MKSQSRSPSSAFRIQDSEFKKALARRETLLTSQNSLARLIDGAADGFPGHFLETYGGPELLSTSRPEPDPALLRLLAHRGKPLYHRKLDQHQKDSPVHLSGPKVPETFTALENRIRYQLSFHSGYSQGIFLDQRDNRRFLRETTRPSQTVLNTFAYTGAFSVCAALAGATTTTLDLSQVYLNWSRQNFSLNELDPAAHHFCKGETFHWLTRFARKGRKFDTIILDPPTFSRDQKGKVFRVEKNYPDLLAAALPCLEKNGRILACTNHRQTSLRAFQAELQTVAPRASFSTAPMPPDFPDTPYLKSVWIQI